MAVTDAELSAPIQVPVFHCRNLHTFQSSLSAANFFVNYIPFRPKPAETAATPSLAGKPRCNGAMRLQRGMPMLIVCQNNPRGRRARAARKWFAEHGPPDVQPLPLGYDEREALKHGGVDHILAWYARSLDRRNYDVVMHPSFHDYACGVMASDFCPYFIKAEDKSGELQRRFPPRPLEWLNNAMVWEPPAHIRKRCGRRMARAALRGRGSGHVVAGEAAQSESRTGCAGR